MNGKKVLVIDDSATIRRLVDSYLSPEGYRVILAATAEDGLRYASEMEPDLILLDHQLPGTTGYEVCRQLLELPRALQTPVVVSSTLRKRAYVEYAELPNVVDMLPKPYTSELLKTTVANALDTGALVVQSQHHGTSVPEVIEQLSEPELSGTFRQFSLREVLDFLNNGGKCGLLEVEAEFRRTYFALDGGRIAGVTASGVDARRLAERLPATLQSLAPVLNLTVSGRRSHELDGITELLDKKVLDPRLLRSLLRHQAALLTLDCFAGEQRHFRFQAGQEAGPLQRKLPLEASLAALLIDGALLCDAARLPEAAAPARYVRRVQRGQNLDRAGVSAQHMKLLSLLAESQTVEDLARLSGGNVEEVRRVLFGLTLAEAVEVQATGGKRHLVILESDAGAARQLQGILTSGGDRYHGQIVADRRSLQLALQQRRADALVFALNGEEAMALLRELQAAKLAALTEAKWVAAVAADGQPNPRARWAARAQANLDAVVARPYRAEQLLATLDRLFDREVPASTVRGAVSSADRSVPACPERTGSPAHDGQLCAVQA